jgi:hypothetical protein
MQVKHQIVVLFRKLVHELCDPLTMVKAVVVEDNDAADPQPRPNPVHDILGGLVYIHIDMTKAERILSNNISSIVWEYALKYLNVIET